MSSSFEFFKDGLSRRRFVAQGSAALAIAATPFNRSIAQDKQTDYVEVETKYGRLRGSSADGLVTFRGVPYAGSVSGPNRFKAAPPLQPWTGVRDALHLGPPSPQPGRRGSAREPDPAEDCLFLNVWTPAADHKKRAVMFYSHGGGFTTGSGGSAYQDGGNLARSMDVVVVATNHRLGLMGYLYLGELGGAEYETSGNQGMLDIQDGLKWVRENIDRFGGDPNNVMIFGESGGGTKTSCLYAMPSAAPYFNKASIESGPGIRMLTKDVAAQTTLMTLKQLGIEQSDWRKVLDVPLDKLVAAQQDLGRSGGGPLGMGGGRKGMAGNNRPGGFGPVVDGKILPSHPFDPVAPAVSKNKPLIVGSNHDEATFFFMQGRQTENFTLTFDTLKEKLQKDYPDHADEIFTTYRTSRPDATASEIYIAVATARMIEFGAITLAERKYEQHGAPVYMYIFHHKNENLVPGTQHKIGSPHAMEIMYKFNNIKPADPNAPAGVTGGAGMAMAGGSDPAAVKAAHNMAEMWSTFARTGHPGAKGQPAWPAYDTKTRATMEIDADCKIINDPYTLERKLWERIDT